MKIIKVIQQSTLPCFAENKAKSALFKNGFGCHFVNLKNYVLKLRPLVSFCKSSLSSGKKCICPRHSLRTRTLRDVPCVPRASPHVPLAIPCVSCSFGRIHHAIPYVSCTIPTVSCAKVPSLAILAPFASFLTQSTPSLSFLC